SSADGKNNQVYDEPEFFGPLSFTAFLTFFFCRPLQLFANFGSLTKFLRRFGHQHWIRSRRRNRSHWLRYFPSSKPLQIDSYPDRQDSNVELLKISPANTFFLPRADHDEMCQINNAPALTVILTAPRCCLLFVLLGHGSPSRCITPGGDVILSSRNLRGVSGTRCFLSARCASTCLMKTFSSCSCTTTKLSRPSFVLAFGKRCSPGPADRIFIAPQRM